MKYKIKAFTLTELLIALGIIGTIAAISIPSLMNTINNRLLATQLKSNVTAIQQLASDKLVTDKVRSLEDTDFKSATTLLNEGNFSIAKICDSASACWDQEYKRLSDLNVTTRTPGGTEGNIRTAFLKNGALLSYSTNSLNLSDGDKTVGNFYIDVNGRDKPNILGRDYFCFYITGKGKIIDAWTANNKPTPSDTQLLNGCKDASTMTGCLTYIQQQGWVINY